MIVSLENVPKNLENLRKTWNLKMRISTKSFYKLFSVVHNYFLWMFLIIERKYVDRIPPKCPKKLRKCAKKRKTWKCEYLLNHSTNFSGWFTTTFQRMCIIQWKDIWCSYPSKMYPKNLEKLRENEKLKMRISTKPFYKLFSSQQLSMVSNSERIYDDRISPKCSQKLMREKENLKMRISTNPLYKVFSVVHNFQLIVIEDILWSYPFKMSPCEKWKCQYLLNHSINFSVRFTTTFNECV